MSVALARKTLVREWRRFMPALLTLCFAAMLLWVQAALVLGIFGSAAVYITASAGDLWAGYPGTQSVSLGHPINRDLGMLLRTDPEVTAVDPLLFVDGYWHKPGGGNVEVYVSGVDLTGPGLVFRHLLTPGLRATLAEPGAVIVDRSDLAQLDARVGSRGRIDGHPVRVVAAVSGLRALGGVNMIASRFTARGLDHSAGGVTYWVAKLADPGSAARVRARLSGRTTFGPYELWPAHAFAQRSQRYWLLDTGAGVAVLFLATIVLLSGAVIASQALMAVVVSSAREFATLNALGVGFRALRWVVLEQAAWVGGVGLVLGAALSAALLWVAHHADVPVAMTLPVGAACALAVMLLALVSGVMAMRGLLRADPGLLLR